MVRRMSIKEGLDRVGDDVDQYYQVADESDEKAILNGAVADMHHADILDAVKTSKKKLTEKGKKYQQKVLFEKKNLHVRIMSKRKLLDDLMYSSKNLQTVEEETQ